jgi:hypothetical protein
MTIKMQAYLQGYLHEKTAMLPQRGGHGGDKINSESSPNWIQKALDWFKDFRFNTVPSSDPDMYVPDFGANPKTAMRKNTDVRA